MTMPTPSSLTDGELVAAVTRIAGYEREATASLIAHLAELYARRLHECAGYSSLFTYCLRSLRFSEHEAYDRMKAAKVVRRYPSVLDRLAAGRLNLTTIRLVAPHLTRENHEELLAAADGRTKREVQEMLARRFPRTDVASSVRKLPAPRSAPIPVPVPSAATAGGVATAVETIASAETKLGTALVAQTEVGAASTTAPARPLLRPLAEDRYQITFTASADTCETLELARDLLRHALPSGDPAQIVARALQLLVQDLVRQKYAATDRPRASRGQDEGSRHIPAEVKRAVFIRDRGRCAFVGTGGRRCGERAFVEFHHVRPYAAGGLATVDNIELRCRAHNRYEAELFFEPVRQYRGELSDPQVPCERVPVDTFSFRNENVSAPRAAP